jgi:hypothetical protein
MSYMDPELADRINRKVDELNARITRASEIQAQAKARLEREQAEREIARRERRTAIQADAAELYQKWGSAPPIPVSDETSSHYKRRVLKDMQKHLPPGNPFSAMRLTKLPDDPNVLGAIAPRIEAAFSDSYNDPATVPEGTLREIHGTDHGGHKVSSFIGRRSFIHDMVAPVFKVVGGVNGGLRRNAELNSSRSR